MKIILYVIFVAGLTVAKTQIPIPDGISRSGYLRYQKNIGDFDGDKSDDVFMVWGHESSGASEYRDVLGIYSPKKNSYLVTDKIEVVYEFGVHPVVRDSVSGKRDVIYKEKLYTFDAGEVGSKNFTAWSRLAPRICTCKGVVNIYEIGKKTQLYLFGTDGRLLVHKKISGKGACLKLNYPTGTYFLMLKSKDVCKIEKIAVVK